MQTIVFVNRTGSAARAPGSGLESLQGFKFQLLQGIDPLIDLQQQGKFFLARADLLGMARLFLKLVFFFVYRLEKRAGARRPRA